jgi:hypothetical protein
MSYGAYAGGSAAAVHESIANATKASGAIIKIKPDDFVSILNKGDKPLVVYSRTVFLGSKSFRYLTSYKGLIFFTKCKEPLHIPSKAEVIQADKIWIPN